MADNDYNIIKPVDGLQNIGGLAPAKRRKERKEHQYLHKHSEQEPEQQPNESVEEQEFRDKPPEGEDDQNTIDYRA